MDGNLENIKNTIIERINNGETVGKLFRLVKGKDLELLKEETKFLDETYKKVKTTDRINCLIRDINSKDKLPICKYCGENICLLAEDKNKAFSEVCSQKCGISYGGTKNSDPERSKKASEKRKQTVKDKYNVDHISQIDEIKKRKHETATKNYGSLKSAYHDTMVETIKDKYNTDNISKLDWIKQKKIETSRKNWGTDYPWQSEEGKKLIVNKLREKYGVDNVSQLDEVKAKKIETSIKNWDEVNPSKHPEVRGRILKSSGKEYLTPSGKTVLYDGFEDIVLEYLYKNIEEDKIITQPTFCIKYNLHDKERVWFPDCLILNNPKELVEFKTVFDIEKCEEYLLASKLLGYDSYIIFERNEMLTKLDVIKPGEWAISSLDSNNEELIRLKNWFYSKGIKVSEL
ncbi:MAG: DUF7487 domain-containing protein [bacterium]